MSSLPRVCCRGWSCCPCRARCLRSPACCGPLRLPVVVAVGPGTHPGRCCCPPPSGCGASSCPKRKIKLMLRQRRQYMTTLSRARICKRLRSLGIDSKETSLHAYVAWRAATSNRVVEPARRAGNRFLGSFYTAYKYGLFVFCDHCIVLFRRRSSWLLFLVLTKLLCHQKKVMLNFARTICSPNQCPNFILLKGVSLISEVDLETDSMRSVDLDQGRKILPKIASLKKIHVWGLEA